MWTCLLLAIMPPPSASTGGDASLALWAVVATKHDGEASVGYQIESLGSPVFAEREQATRQLVQAGLSALSQLEPALQSPSAEVRSRAVRIFGEWLNSADTSLAAAAEAALSRVAEARAVVATTARARLDANDLHRETALLTEMDRLVPLTHLAMT